MQRYKTQKNHSHPLSTNMLLERGGKNAICLYGVKMELNLFLRHSDYYATHSVTGLQIISAWTILIHILHRKLSPSFASVLMNCVMTIRPQNKRRYTAYNMRHVLSTAQTHSHVCTKDVQVVFFLFLSLLFDFRFQFVFSHFLGIGS